MPMSRARAMILLIALCIALGACSGGGGTAAKSAAQRLSEAAAKIGAAFGRTAPEIETGIRVKMPNATIDELAAQAERSAAQAAQHEAIAVRQAAREADRLAT